MQRYIALSALLILLTGAWVGCASQPSAILTPAGSGDPVVTPVSTLTLPATLPPTPTDAPTLTATPPPTEALPAGDHYWLERPISDEYRSYADRTYAYGMTAGGRLRPHTAIDIPNPAGTPVLAVGNAVVFYAGDDAETQFGLGFDFYGNLIVLQLTDHTFGGKPIYALYGHLNSIDVEAGQAVTAGQVIGTVGGTGIAYGAPHLHFEVRIGDPLSYATSTRNPDLWIRPYYGYGTLAGRIVDTNGNLLREVPITIQGEDMVRYTLTYAGDENIPDEVWGENFTYGDLPQGWYSITTGLEGSVYRARVYVYAGQTAWVEFVFR